MQLTTTMLITNVFYLAILIGLTQGQWGAELSAGINNIIEQSVAPLRNMNLTPIINEEYQRSLNNSRYRFNYQQPGYGYGYGSPGYGYSYNYSYPGYDYHYSYKYPARVSRQTTTIVENFWKDFRDNLDADMEAVRNLARVIVMKQGYDGYTVIKFKPSGRVFLIRNDVMYECTGTLSLDNGQCSGDLKRFEVKQHNENYCFLNNKIVINNYYCFIPKTAGYIVNITNDKIVCKSYDINEPAFLISTDDYGKLCAEIATSADYIYFPDDNIDTGNLACSGTHPKKCTYSESSRTNGPQEVVKTS